MLHSIAAILIYSRLSTFIFSDRRIRFLCCKINPIWFWLRHRDLNKLQLTDFWLSHVIFSDIQKQIFPMKHSSFLSLKCWKFTSEMNIVTTETDNFNISNRNRSLETDYIDPDSESRQISEHPKTGIFVQKHESLGGHVAFSRSATIYIQKKLLVAVICFKFFLLLSVITIGFVGWIQIKSIRSNLQHKEVEYNEMSNDLKILRLLTNHSIDETRKVNSPLRF